jgi:photosystem II stability/assembly factor-like uncharacterized protein
VAVGWSGTILTSTDGTTWTSRTSGTTDNLSNVHYNSGFVAVGNSGKLLVSSNGITWTDQTSSCGMTENLWGISSNSTVAVAVGDNGSIYTSTDGTSCTTRTSGTTEELNELIYGNSTFVAAGDNGTVLTSSDGITWTSRTSGTTNNLYGGSYIEWENGDKAHVLVGESGKIIYSRNQGTSWETWAASSATANLHGMARGVGGPWVWVGRSGTIYTSGDDDVDVTARTSGTTESLRRVFYKP